MNKVALVALKWVPLALYKHTVRHTCTPKNTRNAHISNKHKIDRGIAQNQSLSESTKAQ